MKAVLLTVLVAAVLARRMPAHQIDLGSFMSEYAGNSMLNQASGGLLGSNQSMAGALASKFLGVQPQQPQNGLSSMLGGVFGGQQPQPQPEQSGLAGLAGRFFGGNSQPQQPPAQPQGGFSDIASRFLGGNTGQPASVAPGPSPAPSAGGSGGFSDLASRWLGGNNAAPGAVGGDQAGAQPNAFSNFASKWFSNSSPTGNNNSGFLSKLFS